MLKRSFPGDYASLVEIADYVKNAAAALEFTPTDLFALETAVDEAVSNIIEHAYEGEGKGEIFCSIETSQESITIILEDTGKCFDPTCVPIPDLNASLEDRLDHGLGVYMMCQLLDDVKFDFVNGRNRVTLTKKVSPTEIPEIQTEPPPLWRQLLGFGEDLLKQPNALKISERFNQTVEKELGCQARLWLAEPFYPLPGEPPIETLPSAAAEEIVHRALTQKKIISQPPQENPEESAPNEIAFPLATQGSHLGVLHVRRPPGQPFTRSEIERLEGLTAFGAVSMQVNRQESLKNWRYDQISLVRSVSSQIANVLDLDELCMRVTNLIQCSFDYYHVSLFTLEEGLKELKFRASSLHCEANSDHPLYHVIVGEGLVGEVALTGKEIVAKDVTSEPRFRYIPELSETRSEAVLPLLVENRILGVLDVQSSVVNAFHETDLLVVRALADNIALAVEGARLYHNLKIRADQMAAVAEINFALSSILDLDELLREIVTVIHARFEIPSVHIYTVHPGRKKIIFQAGSGKRARRLKINSFAYDLHSPVGMIPNVARTGKAMLANDVALEPLFKPSKTAPEETKSEMTIPLKFGDEVLGVLDLQSNLANKFDTNQLNLFEGLASGIALSIRNATLFRSEKWRRKVAEIFKDVAGLLSSDLALDALLDNILSQLEKTLPCDASAIWLLEETDAQEPDNRALRLAAVRGTTRGKVIEARTGEDSVRKFLDLPIQHKQPVTRTPTDPYGPLGVACNFEPNYSSIAVPLMSSDEVIGVLTLAHHAAGRYGSEATLIVSTFASYAAVAIENASLYTKAQEDAWSSTVLLQVAEAMQSIANVDELMNTMARLTPLLVGIGHCAFFLKDAIDHSYKMASWYGFSPTNEERVQHEDESIGFLKMSATASPVFVHDPKVELGLSNMNLDPESDTMVLIPLASHGEVLGGFLVSHTNIGEFGFRSPFNDQTLAILQGIAQQTSIALSNIHLIESRQEEAYITAVLLQVAQAVVSQNDLDDILDTIVHLMPILVGVDTCVIYLKDDPTGELRAAHAVAPGHLETVELLSHRFQPGEFPLLDDLLSSDSMVACPLDNPDLPISDWLTLTCIHTENLGDSSQKDWLLGFPLSIKGVIYGALVAKESNVVPAFHNKRLELIRGVAQQTTLAIQNEKLKVEMVGRERMEREFQLAREIQKTFLPETLPTHPGWDLDLRWHTAREVGGDFYDVFTTRDGKIALVIADVADKGMPAALYMTVTRTLIRATSQGTRSPAKVLERVNELLEEESRNGMFVTAFFAVLDPESGVLEYANAGHNLPILVRSESKGIERLEKDGIALGVLRGAEYQDRHVNLENGDTLLLYTDGVTEAFSAEGELFSEPRLAEALTKSRHSSAGDLLSGIEALIQDFRQNEPPSDDLTMIAVFRQNPNQFHKKNPG